MQITEQISLYADSIITEPNGKDGLRIILTGIDVSQIIAELSTKEILDAITVADGFSDIAAYVTKTLKEEE